MQTRGKSIVYALLIMGLAFSCSKASFNSNKDIDNPNEFAEATPDYCQQYLDSQNFTTAPDDCRAYLDESFDGYHGGNPNHPNFEAYQTGNSNNDQDAFEGGPNIPLPTDPGTTNPNTNITDNGNTTIVPTPGNPTFPDIPLPGSPTSPTTPNTGITNIPNPTNPNTPIIPMIGTPQSPWANINNTDIPNDQNICTGCNFNPGIPGGPVAPYISNVNIPDPCLGQNIGNFGTNGFITQNVGDQCDPYVMVPIFPNTTPNTTIIPTPGGSCSTGSNCINPNTGYPIRPNEDGISLIPGTSCQTGINCINPNTGYPVQPSNPNGTIIVPGYSCQTGINCVNPNTGYPITPGNNPGIQVIPGTPCVNGPNCTNPDTWTPNVPGTPGITYIPGGPCHNGNNCQNPYTGQPFTNITPGAPISPGTVIPTYPNQDGGCNLPDNSCNQPAIPQNCQPDYGCTPQLQYTAPPSCSSPNNDCYQAVPNCNTGRCAPLLCRLFGRC